MGGKGGGITVKGARDVGEWVDRAALTICGLRDGLGFCGAGSWLSAVAPDEVPVGVTWRRRVGELGVGLVGEDRTCARRVSSNESCGRYTAHPIILRLGTRALGADTYTDIRRIQRIAD